MRLYFYVEPTPLSCSRHMRKVLCLIFLAYANLAYSQITGQLGTLQTQRKTAEARYTKTVDSWVGSDINELILSWGAPSRQYTMPNGTVIFTWLTSNAYTDPASVVPDGSGGFEILGGDTVTYSCTTEFFVNKSGIVYDWKWRGNACRQRK